MAMMRTRRVPRIEEDKTLRMSINATKKNVHNIIPYSVRPVTTDRRSGVRFISDFARSRTRSLSHVFAALHDEHLKHNHQKTVIPKKGTHCASVPNSLAAPIDTHNEQHEARKETFQDSWHEAEGMFQAFVLEV